MHVLGKTVATVATVAAVSTASISPALADPSVMPPLKGIVGVGSGTLDLAMHAVVVNYNYDHKVHLYSWNSVNPTTDQPGGTITAKASGSGDATCQVTRPDGSDAGIAALESTATDGGYPCVDFARSDRGPQPSDPNTIAFVALAQDAISWASPKGTSSTPSPAPQTLTLTQLANIYKCSHGYTTWSDVGGSSNAPIVPVLPQATSGVRLAFLLAMGQVLGRGAGVPLQPGPCVVDGSDSAGPIEEDTGVTPGNQAVFGTPTAPLVDSIVPYAISAYIAQTGHRHPGKFWKPAELALHRVTDSNGVTQAAIKVAAGNGNAGFREEINPSFPAQLWRTIYDVVPNAGTAAAPAIPTKPVNLQILFGNGTSRSGWFCSGNGTGPGALVAYGFSLIGNANAGCGLVTDKFLTYGS